VDAALRNASKKWARAGAVQSRAGDRVARGYQVQFNGEKIFAR
jgi:hypothetical protein